MKKRFLLAFALPMLNACAPYRPPLPASDSVANRCNAFADRIDGNDVAKWRRYVSCTLGSYMVVPRDTTSDNPEAIVSIRLHADGSIESVSLLRPSGNAQWDAAVQRAISAASPLPAAPASRGFTRVDMHFRARPEQTTSASGLHDRSHWTIRHCTVTGSLKTCG